MLQKISIFLIGTLFLTSIYYFNQKDQINEQDKLESIESNYLKSKNNEKLNILLIGDYGSGTDEQQKTASYFNQVAQDINADFIIGTGDNFYEPDGVSGLDDEQWNMKWADVYQSQSFLKDLTWYGTIGNHDFNGEGLFTEFEYKKYGWKIDDFFYTHTTKIGDLSVAIIHIDTNFLAYGIQGEDSKPLMKQYFQELGWIDDQQILIQIEEQLMLYKSYDWKIVVGHHPIGVSCQDVGNTSKVQTLLKKYNVNAYISGHAHQLAYGFDEDLVYILSGAGGYATKDKCDDIDPSWSKGKIYGFMHLQLTQTSMKTTAYYASQDDIDTWKNHSLLSIQKQN